MGRKKIEIKAIDDKRNRSVTFLKRKGGLFKKARELSILCSADITVLIFNNRKIYEYSSSNPHDLITRYQNYCGPDEHKDQYDYARKSEADAVTDDDTTSSKDLEKAEGTSAHDRVQRDHFSDIRRHTPIASLATPNDTTSPAHHGQNPSPRGHRTQTSVSIPDLSNNDSSPSLVYNDDRSPQPQTRQPRPRYTHQPPPRPIFSLPCPDARQSKTVPYPARTKSPLLCSRSFTSKPQSGHLPILAPQFQTNGLTKGRLSGRSHHPKLTVQIPNGDCDQGGRANTGDSKSMCRLPDDPLHARRREGSVVPTQQYLSFPALLFPGPKEPMNATMRPPLHQQSMGNAPHNTIETPQPLLPSRYLSNDFLISPNGFGLESYSRTDNSTLGPSPFNFGPFVVSSSLGLSPLI